MFYLGVLAIFLNLFNYVPKIMVWIYNWGEGVAWGIKIAFIAVGAVLWLIGHQQEKKQLAADHDENEE